MARRRRLTALAVAKTKAAPDGRRAARPDGVVDGLELRTSASGVKSWSLRYRVGGKQRRATFGRFPDLDLAAARKHARAVLEQADRGVDPAPSRRRESFGTVAHAYLERCRRDRLRTADDIERKLRPALAAWGTVPIAALRKHDILDLIDATAARAPVLANRLQSLLGRIFRWAVDRGLLEASPIERLRPPARETSRDRVLAPAELSAVWRASAALGAPWQQIVPLLILTAARFSEVAGLEWGEVDLDQQTWRLPAARAKSGREHIRPLSTAAVEIIAAVPRLAGVSWLFPQRSLRGPTRQPAAMKARLDALAGVYSWRLHDLRRTAATGMAELGTAPHIVAEVLGHSPAAIAGVTARYQRFRHLEEQRAALEKWAAHIELLGADAKVVTFR